MHSVTAWPHQTEVNTHTNEHIEEEEEEENNLLLDANITWGNILASCCGLKRGQRSQGTCVVEVQGEGWLLVKGTSQDEVVDEPLQVWKTRQLMGKTGWRGVFSSVHEKPVWRGQSLLWKARCQQRVEGDEGGEEGCSTSGAV